MILQIVTYPDKSLRQKSAPVEVFDAKLHEILDNMYETMIDKGGVGLAGIQVGVPKRMLIINLPREDKEFYKDDLLEIINPEILESSGEILFQEGCLSVPNFYEMIQRFSFVKLKFFDRFGVEWILEAEDYLAVALQHEIDHLNGVLFVDKLSILKRKKFEKEFKRLQKEGFKSVYLPESIAPESATLPESIEMSADLGESSLDSRAFLYKSTTPKALYLANPNATNLNPKSTNQSTKSANQKAMNQATKATQSKIHANQNPTKPKSTNPKKSRDTSKDSRKGKS